MVITRKLLIPVLIVFTLPLLVLMALIVLSTSQMIRAEQIARLKNLELVFQNQEKNLEQLSLAMALETASNPEIQAAFANQDRQRLLELTLPLYEKLNTQFEIPRAQFHLAPAIVFLRLQELDQYGDDLSTTRPILLQVNQEKRPVSGLEIGRSGLSVSSVVPVNFQGKYIGSLEYGLSLNQTLIDKLKATYGSDWQLLLRRDVVENSPNASLQTPSASPEHQLMLQASTLSVPFFATIENYAQALEGEPVISRVQAGTQRYTVYSVPIRDYKNQVIGVIDILSENSTVMGSMVTQYAISGFIIFFSLVFGGFGLVTLVRRALHPVEALTEAAYAIAAGEINRLVPVESDDELGILAMTFNKMTAQLREILRNLEARVNDRTHVLENHNNQLKTAAEIARDMASVNNLYELTFQVVHAIQSKYGFYFVAIYLVDDLNETLVINAATGDTGVALLKREQKFRIGYEGIVGYTAARGQPNIVMDVNANEYFLPEPLLPETRVEIALPLKASGRVIGVLDIQHREPTSWAREDSSVLLILADHLALAIENIRQIQRLKAALEESSWAYENQVKKGWSVRSQRPDEKIYEYNHLGILPREQVLPPDFQNYLPQLAKGEVALLPTNKNQRGILIIPIVIHNQLIGVIGLEEDPEIGRRWTENDLILAQSVANQTALSLENARLFEETQQQAEREALVANIANRVRETLNVDTVMKTALREISLALDLDDVEIRLLNKN